MSKETLEEGDEWTQEEMQQKVPKKKTKIEISMSFVDASMP